MRRDSTLDLVEVLE